jgi:DNA-binding phage protein
VAVALLAVIAPWGGLAAAVVLTLLGLATLNGLVRLSGLRRWRGAGLLYAGLYGAVLAGAVLTSRQIDAELAQLKEEDNEAYLARLLELRGEDPWLSALKEIDSGRYLAELAERRGDRAWLDALATLYPEAHRIELERRATVEREHDEEIARLREADIDAFLERELENEGEEAWLAALREWRPERYLEEVRAREGDEAWFNALAELDPRAHAAELERRGAPPQPLAERSAPPQSPRTTDATPTTADVAASTGYAGPAAMVMEDAACRSLDGVRERLDNLKAAIEGRGDFSNTLPAPPPECVTLARGTQLRATGERSSYIGLGSELWLAEVEHGGERRWVLETAIEQAASSAQSTSSASPSSSARTVAAPRVASARIGAYGWSSWSVRERVSEMTDLRRVTLTSSGPAVMPGLDRPSVTLTCYEDGDPATVILRDGYFHFGRTSVSYRFDDGEVVDATFGLNTANGDYIGSRGVHYEAFKNGLTVANRLRFRIEGRDVFDVSLAGSTAAVAEFNAACARIGASY